MKLIVAVVQDKDAPKCLGELVRRGFRATRLASTGGFLKEGNTTLLLGVDDEQVDTVLEVIGATCRAREQLVTPLTASGGAVDAYMPYPVEVVVGGATVFVLDVVKCVRT
ncbi:MAG: cyclic-di-AMP receptor [Firmicutes bacterium]|nr:cyclic-di-AMP receptor [Bacillota bacterium]